jgi:HupE / UreJ protein
VKREPGQKRLSERHPWGIAFLFGLLHGFGFAGALAEIGLPHGEVPMALLAFNLGVEIGQLAIVAATLIILALIAKFAARALRPVETALAYCIGTIASLWFIERMFA